MDAVYKSIALLKCKPELTREDFIAYYENNHVPLIRRLLPGICGYRRNFISPDCDRRRLRRRLLSSLPPC